MDPRVIERLLRQVSDMAAEEISCSECFEVLSVGVELELGGTTLAPVLIRLAQHLGQCGVCREQYETLRNRSTILTARRGWSRVFARC